jgi:ADP-heptose:LPS heptosyltransferase
MMRFASRAQVTFFALQTQVPELLPGNVINVAEELITLADTAALIEQMDLVITVDTSIVHIAGALGKETWLLLPKLYEWRWGLEGEENDWYDSVRVIRQTEHANWAAVLQGVFEHRLPEQFNL